MSGKRNRYSWLLRLLALLVMSSCGGAQPNDMGVEGASTVAVEDMYAPDRGTCTSSISTLQFDGRPVVEARCRFPALTLARADRTSLAGLHRSGVPLGAIGDEDLRATAEFRSFMDSYNIWQWSDQVSEAEALAACRLMLADMRAGVRIDWDLHAREYLARARRARSASGTAVQQPGAGPSTSGAARSSARTQTAPPVPLAPGIGPGRPGGQARRADVRVIYDQGWKLRERLRWDRTSPGTLERLEQLLDAVAEETGALAVILSGTTIVVTGVVVNGAPVELVLTAGGATPVDMELALRLAEPLLDALGNDLRELEALVEPAGEVPIDSRFTLEQRVEYRALVHRPVAELQAHELERILELRRHGGLRETLAPGSAAHKAERWAEYRARSGPWPFERWSRTYDQNMVRASRAHAVADRRHKELGWGEREVWVETLDGETRVLDIADQSQRRGVEVKSGYVTYTANVASELRRDAKLVADTWSITWHVEGRFSEPLRRGLRAAGIAINETQPNTPIKDLRP